MNFTHGKNIIVKVGGTAVASAKSCSIEYEMEMLEVGGTTARARNYRPGRTGWRITCNYLVSATIDTLKAQVSSTVLTITVAQGSSDRLIGNAYCTKCQITGTKGNLATGSFVFQGTGELSPIS